MLRASSLVRFWLLHTVQLGFQRCMPRACLRASCEGAWPTEGCTQCPRLLCLCLAIQADKIASVKISRDGGKLTINTIDGRTATATMVRDPTVYQEFEAKGIEVWMPVRGNYNNSVGTVGSYRWYRNPVGCSSSSFFASLHPFVYPTRFRPSR